MANTIALDLADVTKSLQGGAHLVARYLCDADASSSLANDEHSTNHHGTKYGSGTPSLLAGQIRKGIQLDGSTYYKLGTDNSDELVDFTSGDEWALTMWIKCPTTIANDMVLASNPNESGTDFRSFKLWIDQTTGTLMAKVTASDGGKTTLSGTTDVTDNSWHHIALVVDAVGGGGNGLLYVDGSEDDSGSIVDTRDGNGKEIWLGAYYDASTTYQQAYTGAIDDVRFYSQHLTQTQISRIRDIGTENTYTDASIAQDGWRLEPDFLVCSPLNMESSNSTATFDLSTANNTTDEYRLTLEVVEVYGGTTAQIDISIDGTSQISTQTIQAGTNAIDFTPTDVGFPAGHIELTAASTTNGFSISSLSFELVDDEDSNDGDSNQGNTMAVTSDGTHKFGIEDSPVTIGSSTYVAEAMSFNKTANRVDIDDSNGEPLGSTTIAGRVEGSCTLQLEGSDTAPAVGSEMTLSGGDNDGTYIIQDVSETQSQGDYAKVSVNFYKKIN